MDVNTRMGFEKLFEKFSEYFTEENIFKINHVEILRFPFITDEVMSLERSVLGISQSGLIQLFIVAKRIFFEKRNQCFMESGEKNEKDNLHTKKEHRELKDRLRLFSFIIILLCNEHLTAINFRKKIVKYEPKESKRDIILYELQMLKLILKSPLKRQNKSPMLWEYRKWLLIELRNLIISENSDSVPNCFYKKYDSKLQIELNSEFFLVQDSGRAHHCNYYAWEYCLWLLNRNNNILFTNLVNDCILQVHYVKEWCYANVTDISGWTFFLKLLEFIEGNFYYFKERIVKNEQEAKWLTINNENYISDFFCFSGDIKKPNMHSLIGDNVIEAAKFATSFAEGHETIWVFIRNAICVAADKNFIWKVILEIINDYQSKKNMYTNTDSYISEATRMELKLQKYTINWLDKYGDIKMKD